jgi:Holliday junction resolvase RusA-like endonuclease
MTATSQFFLIEGINPLPWRASEASTGRKNGKFKTTFHKSEELKAYQAAIKEDITNNYPDFVPIEAGEPIGLEFWLWRQRPQEEQDARKVRRSQADATNMQKALEDALQGLLFVNDRDVQQIQTVIVSQGFTVEPCIFIHLHGFNQWAVEERVNHLVARVRSHQRPAMAASPRRTVPTDELF